MLHLLRLGVMWLRRGLILEHLLEMRERLRHAAVGLRIVALRVRPPWFVARRVSS